jgi:hypothetical protein
MVRVQKEGHEEYTLGRDGSNWKIGGPFEATPVVALTEPMLRELAVVRAERCEAHTAKDLAGFGLDKPYLRVTLATTPAKADGEKNDNPAPVEKPVEKVLLVGKPTGPDAHSRFAKLGSGEAVYVVSDKLVAAVDKDALDLLERRLLDLGGAAIDSVKVSGGEAPLTLQKQGDRWQVTQSPAPPFGADPEAAAATVAVWTNLRAQRFAAHGPKADLAKFGLDKPALTVKVTARPAAAGDPKAGPVEHTLVLGKPVEGNAGERYARLDNGPGVAVLSNAAVTDLMRTYLDYVDRTVLKLGPETARSLSRKGGEELELMKKDDGWHLNKPADMKADDKTLENLLGQLATLRAVKVAAYPAKDIKPFGLDTPSATWTLKVLGTDGKPVEHTLKLGKPVDGPSGDRFAQADKSDTVVVLAAPLVGRLLDGALAFRNRNLAQFPDADRIALERGPRKALFAKVDGTWKLTEPLDAPAEQAELEDFLNAAARLRADALVADKPGDLKPYGLDKPEARWRFLAGDKEVLNLQVGSRTPDGRAHAKLAGDNLVFLLDPALTAKVLGEFRTRTVWPTPPDVSQAEGIRFTSLKNPFILEKVDNAWHVAGKPEVKVNAQAVSDTLAAFADLKAQRYVVDRDADLKLYGLEPPQLILEVLTPAGKKVLHIGRPEGESKRVYAQAPEKAKGEVIVLSETDAAKLVRDLGAFTQGADKVGAQP